jgi:hypothetical protein
MLSDEEIKEIKCVFGVPLYSDDAYEFARDIERAVLAKASLQALLSADARKSIQLRIYEKIISEDWDGELSCIDVEHMEHGHEKLIKRLEAMTAPTRGRVSYPTNGS